MQEHNRRRVGYAVGFTLVLIVEILIALFVKDAVIRPYGGDVLVTVLLCCFIRIVFPRGVRLLPVWVFIFATAVEVMQYWDIVTLLGLGDIVFFRILIGTTFSVADVICYAIGCLLFAALEWVCTHGKNA